MEYAALPEHIFNFIWYVVWLCFFCAVLQPRKKTARTMLIGMVLFLPYSVMMNFLPFLSVVRTVAGPLFILLTVIFLFKDKVYKKVLALLSISAAVVVSELIIASAMTKEQISLGLKALPVPTQTLLYLLYLFVGSGVLLLIGVIWKRVRNKYPWNLSFSTWLVLFALVGCQQILVCGWVRYSSVQDTAILSSVLTILLCIAVDIGLFAVMLQIGKNAMYKARSEMLEEQIQTQKAYYSSLTEQYSAIRKIRHDIANHMYTIQCLQKERRYDEANVYAEEVRNTVQSVSALSTSVPPASAAFLMGRKEALEKQDIDLRIEGGLPGEMKIAETDLVTALGNLIDNAAEAVRTQSEDRTIQLKLSYKDRYMVIETDNQAGEETQKNRRIPELERGLGISILRSLAEKYDGNLNVLSENNRFKVTLIMKDMEI